MSSEYLTHKFVDTSSAAQSIGHHLGSDFLQRILVEIQVPPSRPLNVEDLFLGL